MSRKPGSTTVKRIIPRIRIVCGREVAFGPGKAELLDAIARTGSIRQAAANLAMSYMRAWSLIRTMNNIFLEPVVESIRGGNQHGGAHLTDTGKKVLKLYRRMERTSLAAIGGDWLTFRRLLK
jgi:molybdate transport system regulatory protein